MRVRNDLYPAGLDLGPMRARRDGPPQAMRIEPVTLSQAERRAKVDRDRANEAQRAYRARKAAMA